MPNPSEIGGRDHSHVCRTFPVMMTAGRSNSSDQCKAELAPPQGLALSKLASTASLNAGLGSTSAAQNPSAATHYRLATSETCSAGTILSEANRPLEASALISSRQGASTICSKLVGEGACHRECRRRHCSGTRQREIRDLTSRSPGAAPGSHVSSRRWRSCSLAALGLAR